MLQALTHGALRYRLDFAAMGHQRAAVRRVADHTFALWPELLNDPIRAPWTVAVHPTGRRQSVELVPHLVPDPRLSRVRDVPAASHPRLAACMARLAGPMADEVVWDPFCGSGMELIERARLGGVRRVHGSDISAEAVRIARLNFAAAKLPAVPAEFTCGDFRDFTTVHGLAPGSVSLILTNPPMNRRVRTPDVRRLIADLMTVAATVLRPGGRLVLPNPVRAGAPPPALRIRSRHVVDFGGFDCHLEVYAKEG
jgi:predicted RNA methylase